MPKATGARAREARPHVEGVISVTLPKKLDETFQHLGAVFLATGFCLNATRGHGYSGMLKFGAEQPATMCSDGRAPRGSTATPELANDQEHLPSNQSHRGPQRLVHAVRVSSAPISAREVAARRLDGVWWRGCVRSMGMQRYYVGCRYNVMFPCCGHTRFEHAGAHHESSVCGGITNR